ncbi:MULTISPECIES: calcium-translocating P-type ATPase, PMCA-type [Dictyoglomus]|uniref:P-type Ca(2+) transporter n=1 Tax=Dictyoglomus turgidum (strain DSM 6724 / Z-1310) TaxID=515635 RepID=B8E145_DICTD|nr:MULTISPECIES: calcium-translocating P-type ATPase, PMCA-type [Dictyoglomus]ACK42173.1 calcium-translocating P-type ATPase, PMCA-type [Dictyoglomus turgidum DSM 6724]PNV78985.1 MAG: calcium-translocating P-type ATPase, PMCA-type [Dictyoglomus turgidum]HBU32403.1 calcium-translocating P-type ATPase, PMCA-type [Dictyoglomus sp.]
MWYKLTKDEVLKELKVDPEHGLSEEEVRERKKIYGENRIPEKKSKSFLKIFLNQFKEFLTVVLLTATLISFLLGETKDAVAILLIVMINAILGSFQEYKAEKTLESLKSYVSPKAKVVRDGKILEVNIEDLVPGDLVLIEEGEKIPADLRLIETNNLQVDESILTGESVPVRKDADFITQEDITLGDQINMGFKGTTVITGKGKGVVVGTGLNTALGDIAKILSEMEEEPTPLQKDLERLGKQLTYVILSLVAILLFIGIIQGREFFDMFLTAVSLAVAAIPEGLPTVITILLALGVQEMAKRKAIVRKLSAVEALGATSVICTDKTGTLTENKMDLVKVVLPYGKLIDKSNYQENKEEIKEILETAFLASSVRITHDGNYIGDALDVAIYKNFKEIYGEIGENLIKIDEIPFDSARKRVSVLYKDLVRSKYRLCIKGAGEEILKRSTYYKDRDTLRLISDEDKKRFIEIQDSLSKEGLRVLAIAKREIDNIIDKEEWEEELIFLGFIAFIDPLREGVKEAIEKCKEAGIRPIIVTGDYLLTAKKIAEDLGIDVNNGTLYTGLDLQKQDLNGLDWNSVVLFSRVLPEQKMNIVKELKERGEIVAMTGDGVNDAPALKMADIGVGMGLRGTDVAREASDLVLLDDSFATIVRAVEEGRRIFDNIRKVTYYLLSCNFSEIWVVSLSVFLGYPLPLTPIELLWINLVTDGFPALALGVEPPERDIMSRKPRKINEGIINRQMWKNIVIDGILMGVIGFVLFIMGVNKNVNTGRTMAFTGIVFSQIFQALRLSLKRRKNFFKEIFSNEYLSLAVFFSILLQILVIFTPWGIRFFNLERLNMEEFLLVLLLSLIPLYMLIGEKIYEKIFKRSINL